MLSENPLNFIYIKYIRTMLMLRKNKIYKTLIITIFLNNFGDFVF